MSYLAELIEEIKNKKIIFPERTDDTKAKIPKALYEDLLELDLPSKNIKNYLYFKDGYLFQTFIAFYSTIVSEVEISIKEGKLVFCDMDASRLSVSYIEFSSSKEYRDINEKGDIDDYIKYEKIPINIEDLSKRINIKKNDPTDLTVFTTGLNQYLYLIKKNKNGIIAYKTLSYLDLEKEIIPISNLLEIDYDHKFRLGKEEFSRIFSLSNKDLTGVVDISAKDLNPPTIFLTFGDIIIGLDDFYSYEGEGESNASYSTEYIYKFKKILPLIDEGVPISLELKTDHPLKLEIPLKLSNKLKGKFIFYLAPRIEEADFDDEDDDDMEEF